MPGYVNARGLVPLPGASVLSLWESGDVDPDPTNVNSALVVAGSWSPWAAVFAPASQDPNDWGACGNGATVSAVRHTSAGAWEHRLWSGSLDDGGAAFADGGAMGTLDTSAAAGAVVLCDGTKVHVYAIAPGPGSPVRTTVWDGTAWSAWSDAVVAGKTRTWLTGTITPSGRVALAWTESVAGELHHRRGADRALAIRGIRQVLGLPEVPPHEHPRGRWRPVLRPDVLDAGLRRPAVDAGALRDQAPALRDERAIAMMGVFGAFNYGLHLFGGYLGGRFLSNRNLFVGGMVAAGARLRLHRRRHGAALLYWGLALFLTGSGLNVTCINMMLTQRFTPDDIRAAKARSCGTTPA